MNNADTSIEKPLKNLWSHFLPVFIQMSKSFLYSVMCDDERWVWIKLYSWTALKKSRLKLMMLMCWCIPGKSVAPHVRDAKTTFTEVFTITFCYPSNNVGLGICYLDIICLVAFFKLRWKSMKKNYLVHIYFISTIFKSKFKVLFLHILAEIILELMSG